MKQHDSHTVQRLFGVLLTGALLLSTGCSSQALQGFTCTMEGINKRPGMRSAECLALDRQQETDARIRKLDREMRKDARRFYRGQLEHLSNGSYTGVYHCLQGITAARIDFDRARGERVPGVLHFSEHQSNPGVPTGSFRVAATMVPITIRSSGYDRQSYKIVLEPVEWLKRPEGYEMFGANITVGTDPNPPHGRRIEGNIDAATCNYLWLSQAGG